MEEGRELRGSWAPEQHEEGDFVRLENRLTRTLSAHKSPWASQRGGLFTFSPEGMVQMCNFLEFDAVLTHPTVAG